MTAMLEIEGVSLSFGGVRALDNVNLSVFGGEVLGLIGPNGAGKTTVLNAISGIYRPSSGQISLNGERISGLAPHRIAKSGVGRTFQIVQPFAHLTVLENVAVGAMFSGTQRPPSHAQAMERARVAVEQVGLSSKADLYPMQLTLSNRKRLEVARALSTSPKLLMLDEVMAGLNHSEIEELIGLVQEIKKAGITILIIEHVMKAILAVCDRIAVLQFGKVLLVDEPSKVLTDSRVISAYLGTKFADRQKRRLEGAAA